VKKLGPLLGAVDMRIAKAPPKVAEAFYSSPEWRALRQATFKRDGGRCVICGRPAVVADHIVSRRRWADEAVAGSPDTLGNTRSLCREHDNRFKEDHLGRRRGGDPDR
jgi:5-methylcytosine-specific restriction endonuclease McrA